MEIQSARAVVTLSCRVKRCPLIALSACDDHRIARYSEEKFKTQSRSYVGIIGLVYIF
jgi:hypothetical protein